MFFYIVLTPISTTSGLLSTGNTRKYHQIDVYIYQCEVCKIVYKINANGHKYFKFSTLYPAWLLVDVVMHCLKKQKRNLIECTLPFGLE